MMRALRELEDDRVYQNVAELARLQSVVAEGLKRFEFGLRRKVEGDRNQAALSGSDEVPDEFRTLVEQVLPVAGEGTSVKLRGVLVAGARPRPGQGGCRAVRPFRGFGPRGAPAAVSHRRHLRPRLQLLPRHLHAASAREAGGQGWSTDYPDAELNFSIRLSELTKTRVHAGRRRRARAPHRAPHRRRAVPVPVPPHGGRRHDRVQRRRSARRCATYLLKGGFLWVDDFWGSYAWENWVAAARARAAAVGVSDPGHAARSPDLQVAVRRSRSSRRSRRSSRGAQPATRPPSAASDSAEPHVRAISDKHGNVMVLMTHNTDISDAWEREGEDPRYFYQFSPNGYARRHQRHAVRDDALGGREAP